MAIIKEYTEDAIDMRGPGSRNATPMRTGGVTSILRISSGGFGVPRLAELFAEAAKDFPTLTAERVTINTRERRLEIASAPPSGAGYTKLQPRTIGFRG